MAKKKEKYNELTIQEFIKKPDTVTKYNSWNTSKWCRCKCSCGETVIVPYYGVKKGLIKSCGHVRSETSKQLMHELKKTHPVSKAVNLTYQGKTLNITEWSRITGIPRSTISYRLAQEWPVEKILEGGIQSGTQTND